MRRSARNRPTPTRILRTVLAAAVLVALLQLSFHSFGLRQSSRRFFNGDFAYPSGRAGDNNIGSGGHEKNASVVNTVRCTDQAGKKVERDVDTVDAVNNSNGLADGADGFFNTNPLRYRSPDEVAALSYHSAAHCIGDNFSEEDSWKHKSCQFRNLCFDTEAHEFVLFASPEQIALEEIIGHENLTLFSPSTSMVGNTISIGGLNSKWGKENLNYMKWFPKILESEEAATSGIYELPSDAVLIPFHSFAGYNPGHLVWDDWLPLHTLLSTFDLLEDGRRLIYMRYMLPPKLKLWASCDWKVKECVKMMEKFMPLMGIKREAFSTIHNFTLTHVANGLPADDSVVKSKYVCSPTGAAGLGMATDHGIDKHGWGPSDFARSHNKNRAASLYAFRNYMLTNIGVSTAPLKIVGGKFRIVFSINSSSTGARQMGSFDRRIKLLSERLGEKYDMQIIKKSLQHLSLVEQAELVSTAAIFVTVCGGGAVSATFLPKGAALFIFFHDEEGELGTPARLDWDYFNHLGYIRTHWLPRPKQTKVMPGSKLGPSEVDYDGFVRLMDQELDILSHL